MICVVVLQNCMCCVEGETGSCSEACVTHDVDGAEEASGNVEDDIDIKDEILEALIFPPIKTEQEVSLWVFCVRWWQLMLLGHLLPQKGNCKVPCNYFLFLFYCGCHIHFGIWIAVQKRREFLEVIVINGRIILKCI